MIILKILDGFVWRGICVRTFFLIKRYWRIWMIYHEKPGNLIRYHAMCYDSQGPHGPTKQFTSGDIKSWIAIITYRQIPIEHRGLSLFLDVQIDASKEIRACNYLPEVCVEGSEEDVATVETRALCGADGVSGIVPIRLLNNSRGQQWWQWSEWRKMPPKEVSRVSSNCESRRIVQKTNKTR